MREGIDGDERWGIFEGKFILEPIAAELLEGVEGGPVAKRPRIDLL